jgi:hypothetical protein
MTLGEQVGAAIGPGEPGRIPEPAGRPNWPPGRITRREHSRLNRCPLRLTVVLGSLRTIRRRGVDSVCTDDEACVSVGAFPMRK